MIQVDSLYKTFGKKKKLVKAVTNVSFSAQDGQITGLLGPNGAGKSTTLRMLSTIIKPERGDAFVDGLSVTSKALEVRHKIGVMPHNSGLYPRLTAIENIRYYGEAYGMSGNVLTKRVDELCEMLEMTEFAKRRTDGFSQGQRTKVALARALVHKPKNLLLDEPTNGLDVMATRSLRKVIRRLKDEGHCIIFSSHIMQEVAALCDHIAIIANGEISMSGTVDDIQKETGQTDLEDAFVVAVGLEAEDYQ